jgi:hypothetical protein
MIACFVTGLAFAAPLAEAQDVRMGQLVGVLTRGDGFRQTTLITDRGALQFAVPGSWKEIQLDFKLPVANAVFDVPDPSSLSGASNTNCSMAFADPATPQGQAVIGRVSGFGGTDTSHNGWAEQTRTETADGVATVEVVASKSQGFVTAVAMCAWVKDATHDAAYDAYMAKQIDTLLGSVAAAPTPFKARPGETFFTPQ